MGVVGVVKSTVDSMLNFFGKLAIDGAAVLSCAVESPVSAMIGKFGAMAEIGSMGGKLKGVLVDGKIGSMVGSMFKAVVEVLVGVVEIVEVAVVKSTGDSMLNFLSVGVTVVVEVGFVS